MPQRYEREIEELLQRIEGRLPAEPVRRRARRKTARFEAFLVGVYRAFSRRTRVEQLMIAAISLALLSYVMRFVFPPAAFLTGITSVGLFVAAIALSVATHRGYGAGGGRRWPSRASGPAATSTATSGPPWWARALHWIRERF